MKALILGDVHGNLLALEKVLEQHKNEVDIIISHGDVVNYGPWSNECVALLESIGCICLMGNHEEAFIAGAYPKANELVQTFFAHIYPSFKELTTIEGYAQSYRVGAYHIAHTVNNKYYYPDTDVSELVLEDHTIIGHSHHAFQKTLANGNSFTNTGSVGQNRKDLSKIDFVILESEKEEVTPHTISYDPLPVIKEMRVRKFPEICIQYYQSKLP